MDTTALSLCMDNHLPIHVFALADGNIRRVVAGERFFFFIDTATTEIYTVRNTLSLHDALPISRPRQGADGHDFRVEVLLRRRRAERSEEHTSELQSLRTISYAVFCLKKKK